MILALFWLLAFIAIWIPIPLLVYALFASISFGTLAVITLEISGGVSFIPSTILSSILIIRLILKNNPADISNAALNGRHLGMLIAFLSYALLLTGIAPRVFAGVTTMGLNTQQVMPLAPSMGNVTQSLYLANSCLMTLVIYLLLSQETGRWIFRKGLIVGGVAAALSGLADIVTSGTSILDPLRTTGYALLTNADMAGARRVVGLQPEASTFGYVSLWFGAMITLMRPATTLGPIWKAIAPIVGWSCLAMAALSTSSGALSGLVLFLLLITLDTLVLLFRGQNGAEAGRLKDNIIALTSLAIAGGLLITIFPGIGTALMGVFDAAVLQKTSSGSFEERLYWNTVSLDGFGATAGFGLGVGSTRASSWMVALLCGTGVVGTVLLGLFILNALLQPTASVAAADRLLVGGSKRTLLICMVPFAGSATSVDFGLLIAFVFAVLTAIPAAYANVRAPAVRLPGPRTDRIARFQRAGER